MIGKLIGMGVPVKKISNSELKDQEILFPELKNIDLIVLCGFLRQIPDYLIAAFPNKIINLHPSLLPKYGGKGMFGMKVHEAVIANKEKVSGMTIHLVNSEYDEGTILFQSECPLRPGDNPGWLATRIQRLEHEHLPPFVEKFLLEES